ncbi:5-oxoprolinase subunit PxpB, partial [Calderihabitans maritimus]
FGNSISEAINNKVRGMALTLNHRKLPGISEIVPTYRSLLVYYRPEEISYHDLLCRLKEAAEAPETAKPPPSTTWEIPTIYGGMYGPDLEEVAAYHGITPTEVVSLHSRPEYIVYMLGFTPGFLYLGGMDERIATPRLHTPRTAIPAGSVGIAGRQTGVYPIESPGGWRLIGRTPVKLFDPFRQPPVFIRAGDRIRFVPITEEVYHRLEEEYQNLEDNYQAYTPSPGNVPVFEVLKPGMLTTVQDLGRYGYQEFGVPVAGAMDQFALRAANLLVGNREEDACLEITLMGPTLRVLNDTVLAVTGADLGPTLDGHPIPLWQAVAARAGSILAFSGPRRGSRSYLAIAGGIDVPLVMGSRSTYLRGRLGGYQGRALRVGDILCRGPAGKTSLDLARRFVPSALIPPLAGDTIEVRVILGPQDDYFSAEGINTLLTAEYTVSNSSDRMGYRLTGPPIAHKGPTDIISDGVAPGSIQVPANGLPIVMMADRQTTGGYPKIATVITPDLDKLAQAQPGDRIRFRQVSVEKAHEILKGYEGRLSMLRNWLTGKSMRVLRLRVMDQVFDVMVEEI